MAYTREDAALKVNLVYHLSQYLNRISHKKIYNKMNLNKDPLSPPDIQLKFLKMAYLIQLTNNNNMSNKILKIIIIKAKEHKDYLNHLIILSLTDLNW